MKSILIYNTTSSRYTGKDNLIQCIQRVFRAHKVTQYDVNVVLLTDQAIRKMNKDFLQHDYATDVITFPLEDAPLTGEVYISIETARRQAAEYGVTLRNELCRLVTHGALHLVGYDDATDAQRAEMARLETKYMDGIA
jgi:rRNA maturation RNase YbeY